MTLLLSDRRRLHEHLKIYRAVACLPACLPATDEDDTAFWMYGIFVCRRRHRRNSSNIFELLLAYVSQTKSDSKIKIYELMSYL